MNCENSPGYLVSVGVTEMDEYTVCELHFQLAPKSKKKLSPFFLLLTLFLLTLAGILNLTLSHRDTHRQTSLYSERGVLLLFSFIDAENNGCRETKHCHFTRL